MKKIQWLSGAALVLTLGTSARAAQLTTGGVRVNQNQTVTCTAINFGGTTQDVKIELFDGTSPSSGSVFGPGLCANLSFGQGCVQTLTSGSAAAGRFILCRVTAPGVASIHAMIGNISTGVSSEAE